MRFRGTSTRDCLNKNQAFPSFFFEEGVVGRTKQRSTVRTPEVEVRCRGPASPLFSRVFITWVCLCLGAVRGNLAVDGVRAEAPPARSVSVVGTTSDLETTNGRLLTLLPLQLKANDRASSLSVPINLGAFHSLILAEHMVPAHTEVSVSDHVGTVRPPLFSWIFWHGLQSRRLMCVYEVAQIHQETTQTDVDLTGTFGTTAIWDQRRLTVSTQKNWRALSQVRGFRSLGLHQVKDLPSIQAWRANVRLRLGHISNAKGRVDSRECYVNGVVLWKCQELGGKAAPPGRSAR